MKETALYRFYGDRDRLLYAGITYHTVRRIRQHERDKPWWAEVRHMTVEWFPDRKAAEKAEREAIRTERPFYNELRPSDSFNYWEPPADGDWWVTAYPVAKTQCEHCQRHFGPRRWRAKWAGDVLMTRWVCSGCRQENYLAPAHPEFVGHVGRVGGGWMRDGQEA